MRLGGLNDQSNWKILGFSKPWYKKAYETGEIYTLESLDNSFNIRIPTPLIFIATKFCAWQGRGNGDIAKSQDLEDIIYVLENRPRLPIEFRECQDLALKKYLQEQSAELLNNRLFKNYLPGIATRDQRAVINCLHLFSKSK